MTYAKTAPQGAGVFIWQPGACDGGDWGKITARAQQAKLGWVALHNFYSAASIKACKDAGLYVAYSQYCTPANVHGVLESAVNAMAVGADGILLDLEAEWEADLQVTYAQQRDAAIAFLTKVRTAIGETWIGNAGAWQLPKIHPSYPDTIFARYVDAALPEQYWTEQYPNISAQADLDASMKQWATYSDVQGYKALIPIGPGYGTNTNPAAGHQPLVQRDFQNFVQRQQTFAVWSYLHMPQFCWDVLAAR